MKKMESGLIYKINKRILIQNVICAHMPSGILTIFGMGIFFLLVNGFEMPERERVKEMILYGAVFLIIILSPYLWQLRSSIARFKGVRSVKIFEDCIWIEGETCKWRDVVTIEPYTFYKNGKLCKRLGCFEITFRNVKGNMESVRIENEWNGMRFDCAKGEVRVDLFDKIKDIHRKKLCGNL